MPAYDFTCRQCGVSFEIRRSSSAFREPVACPKCASSECEKEYRDAGVLHQGRLEDGGTAEDERGASGGVRLSSASGES